MNQKPSGLLCSVEVINSCFLGVIDMITDIALFLLSLYLNVTYIPCVCSNMLLVAFYQYDDGSHILFMAWTYFYRTNSVQ